jgi:hypothetical protein
MYYKGILRTFLTKPLLRIVMFILNMETKAFQVFVCGIFVLNNSRLGVLSEQIRYYDSAKKGFLNLNFKFLTVVSEETDTPKIKRERKFRRLRVIKQQ